MAKMMRDWIREDVQPFQDKGVAWLSQYHFFRDPSRPMYSDPAWMFSPADGIIIYQGRYAPDAPILDVKGKAYSLRDAMRDRKFDQECLVIGIFMTFFDVHVNRIPYPGLLCYKELDPIDTYNYPMLEVEKRILDELRIPDDCFAYLHPNQRVVNRIFSSTLAQAYYVLQIADYDVDCITPFRLKQNSLYTQGQRFSTVRYGSQVDLIVPISAKFDFRTVQATACHVQAGLDPLVKVTPQGTRNGVWNEKRKAEEPQPPG